MKRVDLTGIWRQGHFYEVASVDQCLGCVFFPDSPNHEGVACYVALGCEKDDIGHRKLIYIKTDEQSVINYVKARLDGPKEKD